jgi:hypothetical protein
MNMPYAYVKGNAMLNHDFAPSFPRACAEGRLALSSTRRARSNYRWCVRSRVSSIACDLGHGDEDMSTVDYAASTSAWARP